MPKLKRKSENQKREVLKERMRKHRSNEEVNNKLRELNRKSKSIKRQNEESRLAYNKFNSQSQKKRLLNPIAAATHRNRLRHNQLVRLSDPVQKVIHLLREKACQSARLADPVKHNIHSKRQIKSQRLRLADPVKHNIHSKRQIKSQRLRLADPVKRGVHSERQKKSQSLRLADPVKHKIHSERQKCSQKIRLSKPLKRLQHRIVDKECHKLRLQDLRSRTIHRERLKASQKQRLRNTAQRKQHLNNLKKNYLIRSLSFAHRLNYNKLVLEKYYEKKSQKSYYYKQASIKSYLKSIKDGPLWPCSSCSRLWFRNSVKYHCIDNLINNKKLSFDLINQCCPGRVSNDILLCTSCSRNILNGKVPKLSLYHKELIFPDIPPALMALTQLEERFLAPRIPFMQIYAVGGNQQFSVKGRVVNVPTEVQESINILPRLPHETDIVAVALKKKKSFSHNYLFEMIRPNIIFNALECLKNCPVFKEAGVTIDYNRLPRSNSMVGENMVQNHSDGSDSSDSEADPQPWNIPDNETFLLSEAIVFAPGENFRPLPLFLDTYAESMSFIRLYGGQLRDIPKHLSYQNWVKSEVMRSDRRCALVSKLFYSSLKLRAQKIASSIGFCLRKTKGAPNVNVQQALSDDFTNQLALHNSGYKVFTPDRGSPAFWEEKKKEVFATIRQLGPPTFFITLSPAETKWPELLVILKKVVDNVNISENAALDMTYEEKARLIKQDPVTCARYFDYRLRKLFNLIKNENIFFTGYPVVDSYLRVEFQQRGSPHIHGLLWLDKAPRYKEGDAENNLLCTAFIDRFVTCSTNGLPEELVQFQRHKHTFTCRTKTHKGKKCRFGIPFFPMNKTFILEPLEGDISPESKSLLKNRVAAIKDLLNVLYKDGSSYNFEEFLCKLGITEDDYIMAVRSTLQRPTIFLKRSPCDIRINGFNNEILEVHRANMDLQFITDTWSCAMYVLNYINKSKRGLSRLLQSAVEEVKRGNFTIREQLRFMANKFLNASEFSAQEAVYYLLSMPLSMSSRPCIFINTGRPENRVLVLKSKEALKKLPENATNIFQKNILDHYIQRPDCLDGICLAEFAGFYNYSNSCKASKSIESDNYLSDSDICQTTGHSLSLKDCSGFITRRKKSKIIRYTRFNLQNDEDNYFREQLMLFTPWRDEQNDLLNVNPSEKYLACKDCLLNNRSKFIFTDGCTSEEDIIESAIKAHQELLNDSNDEDNDVSEYNKQTEFEVLRDRAEEGDILVDVGADLGNKTDITLPVPHLVSEERYKELVLSLNDKQRRYLIHLLHLMKAGDNPIYECILGGAGVGKSRLIETIHQTVLRHFNKSVGAELNLIKVLLCAPTGKAAFAIKGVTLHSAFALPLNQFSHNMPPLSSSVSNTLLSQLHQLKLIVMDEVSMIGSKTLGQIDQRLRQIFRSNILFAGKSIILLGDFNQLAPVGDRYIFQPDPTNPYKELMGNPLWNLFKFYKLTEIMRQKDDSVFATALNNLAVGTLSSEEINLFKSREISDLHSLPTSALRLYRTNAEVHLYNESVFQVRPNVVIVKAVDRVMGNVSESIKHKLLLSVQNAEIHKTYSLPTSLKLSEGIHYMVTNNLLVSDGLVNGAVGILKYIETGSNSAVVRLWIYFSDVQVGKDSRAASLKISKHLNLDASWTPIPMVCRNIRPWESSPAMVSRRQFPVVPAEAITIHKSQGGTYQLVVVHLKSGLRRNELYVAFSRATKLSGLHLVGKFKPPNPPKPNDLVMTTVNEALIKKHIVFSVPFLQDCWDLSIICHNVQSLNAHFLDIVADKCYSSASLLIFLETWTKKSDIYPLPDHVELHRADVSKNRHGYGILVYCMNNLLNDVKVLVSFNNEEKFKSFNLVLIRLKDIFVCAGYKPPSTPFHVILNYIEICLIKVTENSGARIIFMGDFNIDLLSPLPKTFSALISKYNLENKIPNKRSTDGLTQLDICFSNIPSLQASYYESYFSYHKPIVCSLVGSACDNSERNQPLASVDGPPTPHLQPDHSGLDPAPAAERPISPRPSSSVSCLDLPPGFSNADNVSCYANSACQAFLSLDQVRLAVLEGNEEHEFKNIASSYYDKHILSTKELRLEVAFKTNSPQFAENEQQDVVEFISLLAKVVPQIEEFCLHKLVTEYHCSFCQYYSSNSQDNLVIPVSCDSKEHSLSKMFASDYGCWKRIDAACSSCGSHTLESKESVLLSSNPQHVLVVQLGLFDYSIPGLLTKKKLFFKNLCSELVKIAGVSFQVSAVISHHGDSTDSGHYTCKLRFSDKHWVMANDTFVKHCSPGSDDAYVLLLTVSPNVLTG